MHMFRVAQGPYDLSDSFWLLMEVPAPAPAPGLTLNTPQHLVRWRFGGVHGHPYHDPDVCSLPPLTIEQSSSLSLAGS
jgi:hypothetical protein